MSGACRRRSVPAAISSAATQAGMSAGSDSLQCQSIEIRYSTGPTASHCQARAPQLGHTLRLHEIVVNSCSLWLVNRRGQAILVRTHAPVSTLAIQLALSNAPPDDSSGLAHCATPARSDLARLHAFGTHHNGLGRSMLFLGAPHPNCSGNNCQ